MSLGLGQGAVSWGAPVATSAYLACCRHCRGLLCLVPVLSVTRLHLTLRPLDLQHATLPILHCLPEFTQSHVRESVMPSNPLVLCRFLLLPSIFPSISIFSTEVALCIRWLKIWETFFCCLRSLGIHISQIISLS